MIIPLGTCISNNSGCEQKQNRTIMTLNHLSVRNLKGVELRRWQNLLLCCHDWVAAWGNHCIKHLDQIRFFHHVLHTKKINKRKRHKFWSWNSESFDWSVSLTKWDRCDYLWMSFQMGLWHTWAKGSLRVDGLRKKLCDELFCFSLMHMQCCLLCPFSALLL